MEYERLTNKGVTMGGGSVVFYDPTKVLDRLVELEDMIESGYIKILPCKIGDHIFKVEESKIWPRIQEYIVRYIETYNIDESDIGFDFGAHYIDDVYLEEFFEDRDIGKTVFLIKEDAEAKLEELKNK